MAMLVGSVSRSLHSSARQRVWSGLDSVGFGCLVFVCLFSAARAATNGPPVIVKPQRSIKLISGGVAGQPAGFQLIDAGDRFTLPNGQQVRLLRSPGEVVVTY